MEALLKLTALPDLSCAGAILKDRELRNEPLEGETKLLWVLQDGEDTYSRQALPAWVSQPIESFINQYTNEARKWDKTKQSRVAQGLQLTAQQQQRYDAWLEFAKHKQILYNKVDKKAIWKLRSNADLDKLTGKLFSLEVVIQDDLKTVVVRCAGGEERGLVLVRSEEPDGTLPDCLAGVSDNILEALSAEQQQDAVESDLDENFEQQEELEVLKGGLSDEENAAEVAEEGELQILANTSDEEDVQEAAKGAKKVKSFHHRPIYVELESQGLVMVPSHREGVFISYHTSSHSWQGFYPGATLQLSFSFGGTTGRTSSFAWEAF